MSGLDKICILALIISVSCSINVIAHGTGGGEDKKIGDFTIDFGYDTVNPKENQPVLLTIGLYNHADKEYPQFDYANIKITTKENELLFRGSVFPNIPGIINAVFTFPEKGAYSIDVNFIDDGASFLNTAFFVSIGAKKKEFNGNRILRSGFNELVRIFEKYKKNNLKNSRIKTNFSNVGEHVLLGMKECFTRENNECYFNLAQDLSENYETEEILGVLMPLEDIKEVFSRCHELTHYLGRDDYKSTKNIKDSYSVCTSVCWGGCYHGVMEQYFDEKNIPLYTSDSSEISYEIVGACGNQKDYRVSREYFECLHGIGHAMMFITNGDIPYSLLLCDSLKNESEREDCYGGVFMESSSSSTSHPSKFIKDNDSLYPCNILDKKYLATCYMYQSSHFSRISNYNWTQVGELCMLVPEQYRYGCFIFIGSNQVGYTQDAAKMLQTCNIFNGKYRHYCYDGVMSGLSARYKAEPKHMNQFCDLLEEGDKPMCFTDMGSLMNQWTNNPSDFEFVCDFLPRFSTECSIGLFSALAKPPIILKNVQ